MTVEAQRRLVSLRLKAQQLCDLLRLIIQQNGKAFGVFILLNPDAVLSAGDSVRGVSTMTVGRRARPDAGENASRFGPTLPVDAIASAKATRAVCGSTADPDRAAHAIMVAATSVMRIGMFLFQLIE